MGELACFMTLQPKEKLRVLPVILTDVMVMGINFFAISILDMIGDMKAVHKVLEGANLTASGYVVTAVLVVPCTVLFCKMWREWLLEQSRIHEQARNFSVFRAQCLHEEDRPLIQCSIARFMKGIGLVPKDAPDDAALEAFDMKVHLEVPRALEVSVGRVGILYRHACVIFLPLALGIMDSIGVALNEEEPARLVCLRILSGVTSYLAVYPALLALLSLVMRASLRLQKCALIWTSYVLTALVVVALAIGWGIFIASMRTRANESGGGLATFLAIDATMFGLVAFLYRSRY